jgi:tRNA(Ile)-lysidine synthase
VRCATISLGLSRGASTQARAREARYAALSALASERGLGAIAVGHTLDDQAETVLGRLLRGAGVRGLAGALRRREDGVVRPLLDCDRAAVMAFLAVRRLAPIVEDPSNRAMDFQRARVRSQLLPTLALEQPAIRAMLAHLADDAQEHRDLVESLAGAAETAPEIASLASAPPPIRRERLRRWARATGGGTLRRAHLEALEHTVLTARGEVRLPDGHLASIEKGRLLARATGDPALRVSERSTEEVDVPEELPRRPDDLGPPVEEA